MLVKIGNYPSRATCRIYSGYMNKKYGYVDWPASHSLFEDLLEKVDGAIQWVYDHTVNLYYDRQQQKIKVKIDRWDTWSADYTLALIILPMLRQLKETKHGAPNVDVSDVPNRLKPSQYDIAMYNENGQTDEKFFDRWNYVLDEMIFAFESKVDDSWEDQFETGESDIQWRKLENGMSEMVRGPKDTKVYDWEGRKKYQQRISNGFRLFGKYYESLWD